jgi:membrane protein GlpM
MVELLVKACLGAVAVVIIELLARTKNYYLAGLVPLFPTFSLISHYIVGSRRTMQELKATVAFSMLSLVPYMVYLVAVYYLVDRLELELSLLVATLFWTAVAVILMLAWNRL